MLFFGERSIWATHLGVHHRDSTMEKITKQALVFGILGFLAVASVLAGEKKLIQQIREKMQKK